MSVPSVIPSPAQRLAMRERPSTSIVGRQRWSDLLFAHWKVDAQAVQATLPPGLFVDTFEGEAYVGVVPFFMERVRPAWLPPLPWISWFLELNVRTYVHDADGQPGVWFYSLDCNQPVAVAIARRFFHLPYFHARMSAKRRDGAIQYQCQRRGETGEPWRYDWSPGAHAAPAEPGSLEFFLIERYVLFAANHTGCLHEGRVHHAPYRIHTPVVSALSTGPARLAGFDLKGAPASLLGAESVDVSIFPLKRIRTGSPAPETA
ncbi:MAG: DUF2071 domain-containing protein [Chthoniobacteraceae bacterium]